MATYRVNKRGVAKARELIDTHRNRVRSRWADAQPRAAEQNAFLSAHGWQEYAALGGDAPPGEFLRWLSGDQAMASCDHDIAAVVLNEHFADHGFGRPVDYWR